MKDNFSKQASEYAKFRPTYPAGIIEYIVGFVANRNQALDIATGNGQLAALLAHHFDKVYATDISDSQLDHATDAHNIEYRKEPAEKTSFDAQQFDLITVAQAAHWFDLEAFNNEVYRILKPDGVLAIIGYGMFKTNDATDKIIGHFYKDIIGPYWDPERKYLDDNYSTLPFPYQEQPVKNFESELNWNFDQLVGYLETWSAVQHYKDKNGSNPVDIIREDLRNSWQSHKVTFPFLLRIGKLKNAL